MQAKSYNENLESMIEKAKNGDLSAQNCIANSADFHFAEFLQRQGDGSIFGRACE